MDNQLDIKELLAQPKIAHNWSGLEPRSNHAGNVIGSAQLADSEGIFLPGITVDVEVRAPIITNECLFFFSLMHRAGKLRTRVYQLEVCPAAKRSHNGNVVLYGPHEHVGGDEPTAIIETGVNCSDWNGCLSWFMRRINLGPFEIARPC